VGLDLLPHLVLEEFQDMLRRFPDRRGEIVDELFLRVHCSLDGRTRHQPSPLLEDVAEAEPLHGYQRLPADRVLLDDVGQLVC
jgi:hypothetical protein